jgi:hypothetical protein
MTGQILEVIKEKTLSDKLHLMAKTLRSCQIKKCVGKFYDPKTDSMCAYGALGFMSGLPKDELIANNMTKVLANYGIDLDESSQTVAFPDKARQLDPHYGMYPERQVSLFMAIYLLNDRGYSFNEIANHMDNWADDLQG